MSKTVSRDQAIAAVSAISTKIDWDQIPTETLQKLIEDKDRLLGPRMNRFIQNYGKVTEGSTIYVDHNLPLQKVGAFGGRMGGIWHTIGEDVRARNWPEIKIENVVFVDVVKKADPSPNGLSILETLEKTEFVRLNVNDCYAFWECQDMFPEHWFKPYEGNTVRLFFLGTVLSSPAGNLCVPHLRFEDGSYKIGFTRMDTGWAPGDLVVCVKEKFVSVGVSVINGF